MPSPQAPLAVVLAGGRGSRIGGPKAASPLGGRPLVEFPLAAARAAGLETVVVAKPTSELPSLDVEVWPEPVEPAHPLVGVITALERARGRAVIVCACDMPFVEPSLIGQLANARDRLVVVTADERLQPLLGRYEASLLDELRTALVAERSMHETVEQLGPRLIAAPERMLFNVNTATDLERAEAILRDRG